MTSAVLQFPGARSVRFQVPLSPGKVAQRRSEKFSGQPFDIWTMKRVVPDRWRAFLHGSFTSHVHVAYIFSVDEKTARNWWEGIGAPRAEYVLAAINGVPGAAEQLGVTL